ncbi:MAG: hypothetical protein LLG06_04135 [Desulfobacteraceae bacterium]|nr:hypothetical protein [Desulfobacteraceae bacterium]
MAKLKLTKKLMALIISVQSYYQMRLMYHSYFNEPPLEGTRNYFDAFPESDWPKEIKRNTATFTELLSYDTHRVISKLTAQLPLFTLKIPS